MQYHFLAFGLFGFTVFWLSVCFSVWKRLKAQQIQATQPQVFQIYQPSAPPRMTPVQDSDPPPSYFEATRNDKI